VTKALLTIGELSARTDVSASALRFYESEGLIHATRSDGGQRRYHRDVLRRVSFIRIAQKVGLTIDQLRDALGSLPDSRTPTQADWARLSKAWRPQLDAHIAMLTRLRDQLDECIGCGCLSLRACALYNEHDGAALLGPGPRFLLGDRPQDVPRLPRATGRGAGAD
jgi:MerR family redox-sensitive transcriptional activator SoxR